MHHFGILYHGDVAEISTKWDDARILNFQIMDVCFCVDIFMHVTKSRLWCDRWHEVQMSLWPGLYLGILEKDLRITWHVL